MIAALELVPFERALYERHADARGDVAARRGLVVRVRDDSGVVGEGECAPLEGHSRESLEACVAALERVQADVAARRGIPTRVGLGAVDFALELAVADVRAQRDEGPLVAALAPGRPCARFERTALVASLDPEARRARALVAARGGARAIKLKMDGRDADAEVRRLASIRAALPREVAVRVDANRSIAARDLGRALEGLAAASVDLVEEPSSAAAVDAHRGASPPLALDESLAGLDADAIARRLEQPLVRALVLKPMVLGGVARSLAIADRFEGRVVCIASHLLEGPVGIRGVEALATVLAARDRVAQGLPFEALP